MTEPDSNTRTRPSASPQPATRCAGRRSGSPATSAPASSPARLISRARSRRSGMSRRSPAPASPAISSSPHGARPATTSARLARPGTAGTRSAAPWGWFLAATPTGKAQRQPMPRTPTPLAARHRAPCQPRYFVWTCRSCDKRISDRGLIQGPADDRPDRRGRARRPLRPAQVSDRFYAEFDRTATVYVAEPRGLEAE